ncbi:MAG: Tn3 family transposase [Terriglobia bacterium]
MLRQTIEKQMDRIEHADRFTHAVSVGSPREFLQVENEDQELAEACKRLIKNCSICWNYSISRRSWKIPRMARAGERFSMRWPTARRFPGGISICSASTISRKKNCRIVLESGPQN